MIDTYSGSNLQYFKELAFHQFIVENTMFKARLQF